MDSSAQNAPGTGAWSTGLSNYPDFKLDVVAGDAGLGYYSFLHAAYQLGAKRMALFLLRFGGRFRLIFRHQSRSGCLLFN